MNRVNAEKLAAYLETLPDEKFDMGQWCGSACCIAGHEAIRVTGRTKFEFGFDVTGIASESLGLLAPYAKDLFEPDGYEPDHDGPWGWWDMKLHRDDGGIYFMATAKDAARAVRRAIELWCDQ